MATRNRRIMRCSPDDVFATLADGWLYPTWVVGAARMRAVDPEWPAEGTHLHHSLGIWPILVDDTTEVVEWDPPRRARLRAKAGPFGRAVVVFDVREHPDGCSVALSEEPVAGVAAKLPRALWAPALAARNRETLIRLGFLAEGRRLERELGEQTAREDVPDPADGTPSHEASADAGRAVDAHAGAESAHAEEPDDAAAGDPGVDAAPADSDADPGPDPDADAPAR